MKHGKTVLALVAGVAVGALAAKVIEDINDKKSLQKGGDPAPAGLIYGLATIPEIHWDGKNTKPSLPNSPFILIMDASANTIPKNSFQNCSNLISVTLSPYITSIGNSAFQNCSNLKNFTILDPSKLTTIGSNAFNGCTNLNILITSQQNMNNCYCNPYNQACEKLKSPKNLKVGDNAFFKTPYNTSGFKIVPVPTTGNGTSPVCLAPKP